MLRILFVAMVCLVTASAVEAKPYAFRGGMQHVVTKFCGDRVCGVEAEAKRTYSKVQRASRQKVAARVAVAAVVAPVSVIDHTCTTVHSIVRDVYGAVLKGLQVPVDLVEKTIRFFVGKGYTLHAAAGIAGNIKAESNFKPTVIGDGGRARGIAQWHPDRYRGLRKLAAAKGVHVNDFRTQLEYIDQELRERERLAFERLQTARNVREATAAFVHFERPQWYTPQRPERAHSFAKRLQWARHYAERYAHHAPAVAEYEI